MGSKEVLKHTKFGPILVRRKGESLSRFVRRQQKAFIDFQKKRGK